MKYIIRALKYFVYISIVLSLILLVLAKLHFINSDISTMFVNGYDSLWQIGCILLVFSFLYPSFGYSKRSVRIYGDPAETKRGVREIFMDKGYRLSVETDEEMKFVKLSPIARVLRIWEDTITVTADLSGYVLEGRTKDIVRVATALEQKFRNPEEGA